MFGLFKSKSAGRLIIEGSQLEAPIKAGQTILQAATAARIKFPNMCNVGECGTCRCRVIEGNIKLKRDISNHVSREEMSEGYILGCQAIPQGDVIVRVPGLSSTDTATTHSIGRIASLRKLTHDIVEVTIALDTPVHYVAGQYARLAVPGDANLTDVERNYSFASYSTSGETASAVFHIRHVPGGRFTDWLFNADRTGTAIEVTAPYGDFRFHESGRPLLMVAGGSGLAPIKALLEELKAKGATNPVTLFFGAREQRDLYELDFISSLAAEWPTVFNFHPVLSNEVANTDWSGLRGFVTQHIDARLPKLADHDIYMCGPPVMLDSILAHVEGKVPQERIHFDKFFDQSSLNPSQ